MELKEYQHKALETFDLWRETLFKQEKKCRADAAKYESVGLPKPADTDNYPLKTWERLADIGKVADGNFVARKDSANRHIPHVCFKVPTGGGKTLLAAETLGRIQYPRGLVLWVVPTRAIYDQTKDALWDKQHPYRQRLDRYSGGRVKVLEKDDRFQPADIRNHLCVMLLMLQGANRYRDREFLRFNRDSGLYSSFFPNSDHSLHDLTLLKDYPDLDHAGGLVKQSLLNVIKMLRPVVVLDEAHKAYGRGQRAQQYAESINRLNPRLVLEFSATPDPKISNLLVDISGLDLKNEEMIKMPVQVVSQMRANWQDTLTAAHDELHRLDLSALELQQREDRYIRPIAVVRVQRTGKNQRDDFFIHAEDAREYLIQNLGVPKEAIRVKSSSNDELERKGLLSESSPVRWIITKDALKEGWDCSFAYMLVLLDNTKAPTAITQLVGRVLRQPHARLTGVDALDRCYVYCWDRDVSLAVGQVKKGLQDEGLTGLMGHVEGRYDGDPLLSEQIIKRRKQFQGCQIRIPKVLHKDGDGWRKLDHLQHILAEIDWDQASVGPIQLRRAESAATESLLVDLGNGRHATSDVQELEIDPTLSVSWFARRLLDVVPNPWQAAEFVFALWDQLRADGLSDAEIFANRADYLDQMKMNLREQRDDLCRDIFERKLADGLIRYDLRTDPRYEMPRTQRINVAEDDKVLQRYGDPVQLSLFSKVYEKQMDSKLEKDFAFHLDKQTTIDWWHRNQSEYYVVGWRRERIYLDFVAFGKSDFYLFETKGAHMRNSPDTTYKVDVLRLLEQQFNSNVRIKEHDKHKGKFMVIYTDEFPDLSVA